MKFIESYAELYEQVDVYKQIEKCARVSYKSEDKITETSSEEFVNRLIKAKHYAPLEFGTIYLYLEVNHENCSSKFEYPLANFTNSYDWSDVVGAVVAHYKTNQYSRVKDTIETFKRDDGYISAVRKVYITTNYRVIVENGWEDDLQFMVTPTEHHEKRICIKFVTSRGISHEFVRHRAFSFMQESQRFVNYSKNKFGNEITFIKPHFISSTNYNELNEDEKHFYNLLDLYEKDYMELIEFGNKPQEAREVLPNATKTELVMCGFESDWQHFFDLRMRGTTGTPHPDAFKLARIAYNLIYGKKHKLSKKQENVISALKNLGIVITNIEWKDTNGIGSNCILHYSINNAKENTLDITDTETW